MHCLSNGIYLIPAKKIELLPRKRLDFNIWLLVVLLQQLSQKFHPFSLRNFVTIPNFQMMVFLPLGLERIVLM